MKAIIKYLFFRALLVSILLLFFLRREISAHFFTLSIIDQIELHKKYLQQNDTIISHADKKLIIPSPGSITPTITETSTPSNSLNKQPTRSNISKNNYALEPCEDNQEEGCYMIRDAPAENMSSVEELNLAVNQYRSSHDLNQLTNETKICEFAKLRAQEISEKFSHDGFSAHVQNGDLDELNFTMIAENLWQGSFSAVHIVEFGWDKSTGHRANLQGEWNRGCAGIYKENAVYIFLN